MTRETLTVVLALSTMALSACEGGADGMANSKICADFSKPVAGSDAATPLDGCVRRWAYSLAGARDSADVVAAAAVAACGAPLTQWNQGSVDQASGNGAGGALDQPLSLDTGQPTNAVAEHTAFAHRQALLYVVQARAGHCKPPSANKGVPAGA